MSVAVSLLLSLALASTPGPAPSSKAKAQVKAHRATKVLLIDHPTLNTVENYATLVKDHLIDVRHLHIVGIYHREESDTYREAQAYIKHHKLTWMSMREVRCHIDESAVFANNACRQEFKEILDGADGLILNGGWDIQPSLYGAKQSMLTQVNTPARHIFEVGLMVQALGSARAKDVVPLLADRPDFPVLGICVGMQTLNVAGGGTLVQDVPVEIYQQPLVEDALAAGPTTWHRNHYHELGGRNHTSQGVMHPIHLTDAAPDFFRSLLGPQKANPNVLCVHHQAVNQLAPNYSVFATSEDGKVVEMMGRKDFPNVLGVQFHPERSAMWEKEEKALSDPNSKLPNFIYAAMSKDAYTREFNRGVWQWISGKLLAPKADQAAAKPAAAQHPSK